MGLESLESFLEEFDNRSKEQGFDGQRFAQEFQSGLNTSGRNKVQPEGVGGVKRKGFLRETAEAVAGGAADAAEMWMRAVRTVDPEGGNDVIRNFATSGINAIKNFTAKHPSLAPDPDVETGVKRWWVEGVRSFIPSLSAALPGVVVGGAVGGPAGAAIGSTFGGAIFGLAEHDQFKEEVEDYITDNQLSTEDAASMRELASSKAIYSAITEGGLEGAANLLETLSLGLFRPVRRTLKGVVTQPIQNLFKKSAGQIAKEAAVRLPRTAAIEVGTEVTQEALETKFRRDIGLTDMSSIEAAMSVIGPSLVTTLLFFGAAGGANSFQRYSIRKSIEDAKANPNKRKQAVKEISDIVRATGQEDSSLLADQLQRSGDRFVEEGISINPSTQVGVQNQLGEIIKGLRNGETTLDNTKKFERGLAEGLRTEDMSMSDRIHNTQLMQGLSAINQAFEDQVTVLKQEKPKTRKKPATPEDQLISLGDDAVVEGKEPEVIETVDVPVEPVEELEELAEEAVSPEEEITPEEPVTTPEQRQAALVEQLEQQKEQPEISTEQLARDFVNLQDKENKTEEDKARLSGLRTELENRGQVIPEEIEEEVIPEEPAKKAEEKPKPEAERESVKNIPVFRIQAKKQSDGKYKLFFRGTQNEIFKGKSFDSAAQARQFFRSQKLKEEIKAEPVKPFTEKELENIKVAGKKVRDLGLPVRRVVKEEARLMQEEVAQGTESENLVERGPEGELIKFTTGGIPSTFPPYYGELRDINTKRGIIRALKNLQEGKEGITKTDAKIKQIIEERLQGKQSRFEPGTGQVSNIRGNKFIEEEAVVKKEEKPEEKREPSKLQLPLPPSARARGVSRKHAELLADTFGISHKKSETKSDIFGRVKDFMRKNIPDFEELNKTLTVTEVINTGLRRGDIFPVEEEETEKPKPKPEAKKKTKFTKQQSKEFVELRNKKGFAVISGDKKQRDKAEKEFDEFLEKNNLQDPDKVKSDTENKGAPEDIMKELEAVEKELGAATSIFVKATTKRKEKQKAKEKVQELQSKRDELRKKAGIGLNAVDQAKKNIKDKMGRLNVGVDPTILKDVTVVGLHHFKSGINTFSSWSKAMIQDLGKSVQKLLRQVWRQVRRKGEQTDETLNLAKQAVEIEKENHPSREIQGEQVKTIEASKGEIENAKGDQSIIDQINNNICCQPYNVLHNDGSKNNVRETFPDLEDEDISSFARVFGLPYWKAKKFFEWKRAVGIEIKRGENKNLLKVEFGRKVFDRKDVQEGSKADQHEFFALKDKNSIDKVSAMLLEGDARTKEFTNEELEKGVRTFELDNITDEYKHLDTLVKLNKEEIQAYRAWQVTMKNVRGKLIEANENMLFKPYENEKWVKDLRKVVNEKAKQFKPEQATLELTPAQEEDIKAPSLTAKDLPKGLTEAEQKEFARAYNSVIKPKGRIQALRQDMGKLKGYVPHVRDEGTVKVSFMNKDGDVFHSHISTNDRKANNHIAERRTFYSKRDLVEGEDYTITKVRVNRTPEFLYQEISAAALERFSNKALDRVKAVREGKDPEKITTEDLDELREGMKQALADELNSRGFGQRLLRRTRGPVISGYRVTDLKNVLAGYISGASGFMTKMEAAYEQGQLLSDIDVKAKPKLYEEISIYGRNMMRNLTRSDQVSSKIRTMAFVWYLSGQLKSPAVNVTQNWILGIPTLAKFTTGARRKYNKAMFDVARNNLTAEEKAQMLEANKRGITGDQLMQDIFGEMEQQTNKTVSKTIKVLSFPFSFSEIFNRKSAFLARYRSGIEKGETSEQAFDGARDFVNDVHFLFGKVNQPLIATGGTPFNNAIRTSLTFRNYTFNFLNAMKHHIGDRNFVLVGRSMAYMALLGGLSGLPFIEDFLDMWERLTGHSIRKAVQDELKGVGGDMLAMVGTHGLPALIGVDISGSLRIHLPDPTDPARLFEESLFGVYEGLAVKAKDSIGSILDGELLRAFEQASPVFAEKPLKAFRLSQEGIVTTKKGKIIFGSKGEPLKLSDREVITKALGFRPARLAFESGKFRQFTNIESRFKARRDRLFRKLRFARTQERRETVLDDIREYNEDARKQKGAIPLITSHSLRRTARERPSRRFIRFARNQ